MEIARYSSSSSVLQLLHRCGKVQPSSGGSEISSVFPWTKTEALLVSDPHVRSPLADPDNGARVRIAPQVKYYLAVILDRKLNFAAHVNYVAGKSENLAKTAEIGRETMGPSCTRIETPIRRSGGARSNIRCNRVGSPDTPNVILAATLNSDRPFFQQLARTERRPH
ncbi:Hypothetical protein CINCED_3A016712 [Cinara cedri]|uniref:Uncharacterized protein n=1 Tax=Cinara cedri TaxID=506608 RepID=A0A5E4M1N2_9HEMI|nr:Hypothetical protein CINCED_3A016712 [Cinara cedri]